MASNTGLPGPSEHRRCMVLRGDAATTRREALELVAGLAAESILWVSADADAGELHSTPLHAVKRKLGQSFDVVVLDVHQGFNADVLGQCHGFIWGGGVLVLRMPPRAEPPTAGLERMAIYPYTEIDVGQRMHQRLETALSRADLSPPAPLESVQRTTRGTEEQAQVVDRLARRFGASTPTLSVLLSDRGRGKSSALGQAIARCDGLSIAVSAANVQQAAEVFRFATGTTHPPSDGPLRFVGLETLAFGDGHFDLIVIDEAAQISIHLLQQIVARNSEAHMAFATTARGYEGTGRGFVLRFLEWLKAEARPLERLTLTTPIRWDDGDPLEKLVFDALLLDAEPAPAPTSFDPEAIEHVCLDRDALAGDEAMLRQFFGLLVHAHYRTTPGDLHRILDAPNLRLHALRHGKHIVAATMVAEEGGLTAETIEALYWGQTRIRGHALAETMVGHLGRRDAAAMSMIRSVRIAVHPDLRRRGLATRLVGEIHRAYVPDFFGTLFGVTPELLQFRRRVGYELIRIGASRGNRTGEPAAVMVRPVSDEARKVFTELRADLARDLPLQFELLENNDDLHMDPRLYAALLDKLPPPANLSSAHRDAMVAAFAFGPRTQESVATALAAFVDEHSAVLADLNAEETTLIRGRVCERHGWDRVMADTGLPSLSATMRAMRRAVRALVLRIDPDFAVKAGASDPTKNTN